MTRPLAAVPIEQLSPAARAKLSRLGPDSPLLAGAGARRGKTGRRNAQPEFLLHRDLMAQLIGDSKRGQQRAPGAGLLARYPELYYIHAIPNGGFRSKAAAGKAKAEGVLASMCDLCWPFPRYPFHGIYVELKAPGQESRADQRETQAWLRAQGYAVLECDSIAGGVAAICAYAELDPWGEAGDMAMRRAIAQGGLVDAMRAAAGSGRSDR